MPDDLRLKVAASTINGKGIAKLDSDSFGALRLRDGVQIVVTYGAKSIELVAKLDNVYSPATARLMKADMAELRVEAGMEVTVSRKDGKPQAESKAAKGEAKGKKGKKSAKAKAASLDRF